MNKINEAHEGLTGLTAAAVVAVVRRLISVVRISVVLDTGSITRSLISFFFSTSI